MKLVIICNHPYIGNGYGKVMYNLLEHSNEHEYYIWGTGNYPQIESRKFTNKNVIEIVDVHKRDITGYGLDDVKEYINTIKPDCVLIYFDMYACLLYIQNIQDDLNNNKYKLICYLDIVYPYQDTNMLHSICKLSSHLIVFTNYCKRMLEKQIETYIKGDINHEIHVSVCEHAIFNEIYKKDKIECRHHFNIKQSDFIVLNLNKNTTRKRLDVTIMAWIEFLKNNKNAYNDCKLLLKNDNITHDLIDIIRHECLHNNVNYNETICFVNNYVDDENINILYNLADVGINTCDGEGFGLCTFEMAFLEKPQIVPNIGCFLEYLDDTHSYLVDPVTYCYNSKKVEAVGGKQSICDYRDFAKGIEFYYKNEYIRSQHSLLTNTNITKYNWKDKSVIFENIIKTTLCI